MFGKKIIYGCESRGDGNSKYLTRYTLIDTRWLQVCLHIFHRSDADELHDHPWPFASLILWRGYREIFATSPWAANHRFHQSRRVWPGMLLFRDKTHAHRVELIDGKRAVTLVFMGKRSREWGFYTKRGWQLWTEYFRDRGC